MGRLATKALKDNIRKKTSRSLSWVGRAWQDGPGRLNFNSYKLNAGVLNAKKDLYKITATCRLQFRQMEVALTKNIYMIPFDWYTGILVDW